MSILLYSTPFLVAQKIKLRFHSQLSKLARGTPESVSQWFGTSKWGSMLMSPMRVSMPSDTVGKPHRHGGRLKTKGVQYCLLCVFVANTSAFLLFCFPCSGFPALRRDIHSYGELHKERWDFFRQRSRSVASFLGEKPSHPAPFRLCYCWFL